MSPELTTKIRLVRCPKCRLLLAELPDIPVYKCGGCGVTLQAKGRINELRSKSASVNDTEAAPMIRLDRASEDRKSRSSDQDNEWDQIMSSEGNESGNCFNDVLCLYGRSFCLGSYSQFSTY